MAISSSYSQGGLQYSPGKILLSTYFFSGKRFKTGKSKARSTLQDLRIGCALVVLTKRCPKPHPSPGGDHEPLRSRPQQSVASATGAAGKRMGVSTRRGYGRRRGSTSWTVTGRVRGGHCSQGLCPQPSRGQEGFPATTLFPKRRLHLGRQASTTGPAQKTVSGAVRPSTV